MVNQKIVLTGGPGAGKSVIAAEIVRRDGRFVLVAEAATQVYTRLGTTWDRLDLERRNEAQRMIYRLQVEQEHRIAAEHPGKHLLLDRGTIDGATYWPSGPEDYWRDVGSSLDAELARYDAVIWLETAAAIGAYDGSSTNAVRFENAPAAIAAGERLLEQWGRHPRFSRIASSVSFDEKIDAVQRRIAELTGGSAP